jgi:hypothetical protein
MVEMIPRISATDAGGLNGIPIQASCEAFVAGP